MPVDGLLNGKRYLIHDRDPLFTAEFLSLLAEADVASVKLPPRSPNLASQSLLAITNSHHEMLHKLSLTLISESTSQLPRLVG